MSVQTNSITSHPILDSAQRSKDVLLAAAFGLWAVLIGFSPVLAFHVWSAS